MTQQDILNILPPHQQEMAQAIFNAQTAPANNVPLIAKIALGIGAFGACVFILGFLGFMFSNATGLTAFGVVLITSAIALKNILTTPTDTGHIFLSQITFFLMLTGKIMFTVGFFMFVKPSGAHMVCIFLALLTAITYKLYNSQVDRFLSVFVTASFFYISNVRNIFFSLDYTFLHFISPTMFTGVLFGCAIFILLKQKRALLPMAYGFIIATVCSLSLLKDFDGTLSIIESIVTPQKIATILIIAIAALWHMAQQGKQLKPAALLLVLLMLPFNAATLMGFTYITIARNLADRKLAILGYIFFISGLSYTYYSLDITLLQKAGALALSGLILLAIAWFLKGAKNAN